MDAVQFQVCFKFLAALLEFTFSFETEGQTARQTVIHLFWVLFRGPWLHLKNHLAQTWCRPTFDPNSLVDVGGHCPLGQLRLSRAGTMKPWLTRVDSGEKRGPLALANVWTTWRKHKTQWKLQKSHEQKSRCRPRRRPHEMSYIYIYIGRRPRRRPKSAPWNKNKNLPVKY